MDKIRKPYQGVINIIRFNWHFYVIALIVMLMLFLIGNYVGDTILLLLNTIVVVIILTILISISVSMYVYDLSGFYEFNWIKNDDSKMSIINFNAGFDETSVILENKFKNSEILAINFYNPNKHTEVSIKRAVKYYPPYPNTIKLEGIKMNFNDNSIDKIFVILSAHEIRNKTERTLVFEELKRILKPKGEIIVIEHLRDFANVFAYNVGALHFYSKKTWLNVFDETKLKVITEIKNTPFISTFRLKKNGNTL